MLTVAVQVSLDAKTAKAVADHTATLVRIADRLDALGKQFEALLAGGMTADETKEMADKFTGRADRLEGLENVPHQSPSKK